MITRANRWFRYLVLVCIAASVSAVNAQDQACNPESVMRQLQARKDGLVARGYTVSSWLTWPSCDAGTSPGDYPVPGFYDESRANTTIMNSVRDTVRTNFQNLVNLGEFVNHSKADLSQYAIESSGNNLRAHIKYTMSDFTDLQGTGGDVDEVINAAESAVSLLNKLLITNFDNGSAVAWKDDGGTTILRKSWRCSTTGHSACTFCGPNDCDDILTCIRDGSGCTECGDALVCGVNSPGSSGCAWSFQVLEILDELYDSGNFDGLNVEFYACYGKIAIDLNDGEDGPWDGTAQLFVKVAGYGKNLGQAYGPPLSPVEMDETGFPGIDWASLTSFPTGSAWKSPEYGNECPWQLYCSDIVDGSADTSWFMNEAMAFVATENFKEGDHGPACGEDEDIGTQAQQGDEETVEGDAEDSTNDCGNAGGAGGGAGPGMPGDGRGNGQGSGSGTPGWIDGSDDSALPPGFINRMFPITLFPVSLETGHKHEAVTDVSIALPGQDFSINRWYSSDYRLYWDTFPSGSQPDDGLVGANWSLSVFRQVSHSGGTSDITLYDPVKGKRVYAHNGSGKWLPAGGPGQQEITETTLAIGASTYNVYRLEEPGGWYEYFFRAGGDTDADLIGYFVARRDLWGAGHTYDYTLFGSSDDIPRLTTIYLHGDNASEAAAEVTFTWRTSGTAIGRLSKITVTRFDDDGARVVTDMVKYRYEGDSDLTVHADIGSDNDLVQVEKYTRTNKPYGGDDYRVTVTQYRYHTGSWTTGETDPRYNVGGEPHQLKYVIGSEQLEYYAQRQGISSPTPRTVIDEAEDLLAIADDATAFTDDGSVTRTVADMAAKIVSYDDDSDLCRVAQEYIQSSCGCSGGTQGLRVDLDYYTWTDSGTPGLTTKLTERLAGSSGDYSTIHRYVYYDLMRLGGSGSDRSYPVTMAIKDPSSGDVPWVGHGQHDSQRRLERFFRPSAITAYDPCDADNDVPSITISTNSGLAYAYSYTSDDRLTQIRVGNGDLASFGDYTILQKYEYPSSPSGNERAYLPNVVYSYQTAGTSDADGDHVEKSTFVYGFHSGDALAYYKTSVERELVSENGPGTGTYDSYTLIDEDTGDVFWTRSADNSLSFMAYDERTGAVTTIVRNADPTAPGGDSAAALDGSDYASLTITGWGESSDGGELITTMVRDLQGRTVQTTSPGGTNSYLSREMREDSHRANMVYYSVTRLPHILSDDTFDGPASVTWYNAGGSVTRRSEYELNPTGYDPSTFTYTFAQNGSSVDIELTRSIRDHLLSGLVESTRVYHDVMGARFATESDRYDETTHMFDDLGRVATVTNANGTVTKYASYDILNRLLEIEVGTGPLTSSYRTVEERYYDHTLDMGEPVQGRGDGNLTFVRHFTGEASPLDERDTINSFDYRNRLVSVQNPDEPHQVVVYDNLNRVTAQAVFKGSSPPSDIHDSGRLSDRGMYSETEYSQRGMAYVQRVAIDPAASANPASLDYLETHFWFDEVGRAIAQWAPNGPASKREYDGLGRADVTYITDRGGDAAPGASGNYDDAASVTGDVVFEQVEVVFDTSASRWAGNPYLVSTRRRNHDASYSTETGVLDDDNSVISYAGSFYDDADRIIRQVNWGTNHDDGYVSGGESPISDSTYNWPPSTAPDYDTSPYNTEDTIVTGQSYNTRGVVDIVTDSVGKETRFYYDDRNRRYATIENYLDATLTWSSGRWNAANIEQDGTANDDVGSDRVTSFIYDGIGNVIKQTAHEPDGANGDEIQMTEYVYGVTAGSSSNDTDSLVTSENLLKEVRYPDESTGSPGTTSEYKVQYAYNRLGELRAVTDQNGTIHTYDRDILGRVTKDWVTTFGTNVDGQGTAIDTTVKGIRIGYDDFGRVLVVESLDASSVVRNGIEFAYNTLWQVSDVYQDPTGAVTHSGGTPTGDTEVVRYAYSEDDTDNHSRITEMTYPDGTVMQYTYGSSDADDTISRVTTLSIGPSAMSQTDIVNYTHVGIGMFAEVDYAVPDVQLDRSADHDGTRRAQGFNTHDAGIYPAWDRFGRTVRHMWVDGDFDEHGTVADLPDRPALLEITHSYDRSSNRLDRYDDRPGARMPNWDFEYTYDGLDRLAAADRGEFESSTFTSGVGVQEWTLDILGNWTNVKQDLDGDGNFTDNQEDEDRSHNKANEITSLDINGLAGTPFTQHRDKAGNWTRQRRSNASDTRYTHDAWNRLVKVELGTAPVTTKGEYQYNGLHWRTMKMVPSGGVTEERRMFYSANWQLLEERADSDTTGGFSEESCSQTVWGLRYIDDAVLRRTDTNQDYDYADGGERTDYYITDPQFSVCAMISDTGALQERVSYSAYGEAQHHFPADMDGDGDTDSTDVNWFLNVANRVTIDNSAYNPDGDLNRDGAVNTADIPIATTWNGSAAVADGLVSDPGGSNSPVGYAGYLFNAETKLYTVRHRHYEPKAGRWLERDSIEYVDGANLYQYVLANPLRFVDDNGREADEPEEGDGLIPALDIGECGTRACRTACANEHGKSGEDMFSCIKKCRKDADKFIKWFNSERDLTWTKNLPNCPCKTIKCKRADNVWNSPTDELHGYHKGASYCMRSVSVNGHANQCCYDHNGNLITHGSGSGSADKVAASIETFLGHKKHDMDPADLATRLDGGNWGCWSNLYLKVRPQVGSERCKKNPNHDYPQWPSVQE